MTAPSLDALVASPHWEYAPTVVVRGSAVDGLGIIIAISERGIEAVDSEGWRGLVNPDFIRPDVEHPANHGHMLTLVRKAWGPVCRVDFAVFESGSARVEVLSGTSWDDASFTGASIGLALAAALLAAPLAAPLFGGQS
jgi:hypothetical protein